MASGGDAKEGSPAQQQQGPGRGATFTLVGEDYTLANALRVLINRNPHVEFCGFSAPHPSEDHINLRIQTTGEISARQALRAGALELKRICEHVKSSYQDALANSARAAASMDVDSVEGDAKMEES